MKYIKKLILLLLIPIISLSFVSCQKPWISNYPKSTDSPISSSSREDFDSFTKEVFITEVQSNTITLNYSLSKPEYYGIEVDKVAVGHFSPSYIQSQLSIYENYLAVLKSYPYNELSESQQITYDSLEHFLTLELTGADIILYHDVLGPTTGMQAQLPVLLAEFNIDNKEDLDIYLALVESTYNYFEEICEFQHLKSEAGLFMNKNSAQSIILQCEDFISEPDNNFLITTINEKITNLNGLTEEEVANYQEANKNTVINSLIPAYEMLINTLNELKDTGVNDKGLYYYDKGKEFYEYLIAYNTNSSKSIPDMIKMLEASINEALSQMSIILQRDPSIYEKLMTLSFPMTDPNEIITHLDKAILTDFPEITDVECIVEYIPESLQDHLSPAMYLVPALDDYENNIIYINPVYDMTNIFPTMAHEGYPGHLYQSVYFRETDSAPIRSLLNFGGYVEGWATYAEYYSYYLSGIDEDVADFIVANMVANMGIYCMLDIGIHYKGWTTSDADEYLNELGIQDKELTTILYETIVEEPCIYPQYGIGYLELMELKDKAESKLATEFTPKDFHTFILDIGPAPFPVIEERLDEEIKFVLKKAS